MTTVQDRPRVVVVGGGYGGMTAALRAAGRTRRRGAQVTLIDMSHSFVERIRLHQLAAGQQLVRRPIARLLRGTGVTFIQGRVLRLDPQRCEVTVATPEGLRGIGYDYAIYALGSTVDTAAVPGVRDHALTLGSEAAALTLRDALPRLAMVDGHLVVVGGGLTGIEAAAEIAETYPELRVSLVTQEAFGAALSQRGRAYLRSAFDRLGIAVRDHASVVRMQARKLEVEGQAPIPFDLCLWAGSFSVLPLAREAGLAVNERGQVLIDPYMRSLSHPSLYAAGDAAAPASDPGAPIRMACATAMPMGAQAADNVSAAISGRPSQPFSFAYIQRCISLGRRDALIQFVHPDDTPKERIITGRPGAWYKELINRSTLISLGLERRWAGACRWPRGRGAGSSDGRRQSAVDVRRPSVPEQGGSRR